MRSEPTALLTTAIYRSPTITGFAMQHLMKLVGQGNAARAQLRAHVWILGVLDQAMTHLVVAAFDLVGGVNAGGPMAGDIAGQVVIAGGNAGFSRQG